MYIYMLSAHVESATTTKTVNLIKFFSFGSDHMPNATYTYIYIICICIQLKALCTYNNNKRRT